MANPTFDIIVPHYGTGALTDVCRHCLVSIRMYSRDYRIILIDNASPDFDSSEDANAAALRQELRASNHLLVRNTQNLGFIKAVNQGILLSTAEYVVLMNNDARAALGWLEKLRRPLLRFPSVGLSGPRTDAQGSWQGRWRVKGSSIHVLAPGRMLAFFCVMIRRKVFSQIGLLDESYGVGLGDDDEYCRRAEQAGIRLALVQDLVIPHLHRTTFKTLYTDDQIRTMQDEAMVRFKSSGF